LFDRTYTGPGQSERLPRTSPEKFYEFLRANMPKLSRKDRPSHPYGKGLIEENFGIAYEPG